MDDNMYFICVKNLFLGSKIMTFIGRVKMRGGQEKERCERKKHLEPSFNMKEGSHMIQHAERSIDNGSVKETMTISEYSTSELPEPGQAFT